MAQEETLKINVEADIQDLTSQLEKYKQELEKLNPLDEYTKKLKEELLDTIKETQKLVNLPRTPDVARRIKSNGAKISESSLELGLNGKSSPELTKITTELNNLGSKLKTVNDELSTLQKSLATIKGHTVLSKEANANFFDQEQNQFKSLFNGQNLKSIGSVSKTLQLLQSATQNTDGSGTFNYSKTINGEEVQFTKSVQDLAGCIEKLSDIRDRYNEEIANIQSQITAKTAEQNQLIGQQTGLEQQKEAQIKQLELNGDLKTTDINLITQGQQINITAEKIEQKINGSGAPTGDAPNEDLDKANAGMENVNTSLNNQSGSIGKAVGKWFSYRVVLGAIRQVAREAISTITELDEALTTQAMVSGKTREETYALLTTYQDMASTLGTTTKEVASVATQYLRQGKSVSDTLKLTEAAIQSANVAGISASEAVDYLTTAVNGFNMEAEDAITVSDKFAALAANSATSYEELATALSKVASQANLAGMSMDYTLGLLAKGIETTRESAESIGTALKTVIARMREISDYGETIEDGTDLNNVETQLRYVGIALRSSTGELRSTEDVLDDLGKEWDTLSSNQQAAIAKALAGTRQQSRLIAMMSDYDRTLELVNISQKSTGATAAQQAVYMDGLEASTNKLTSAYEKLVSALSDSDIIIMIVNGLTAIVEGVANLVSTIPGMITLCAVLAPLIGLIAANIWQKVKATFAETIANIADTAATIFNTNAKAANTGETVANAMAHTTNAAAITAEQLAMLGLVGLIIAAVAALTALAAWLIYNAVQANDMSLQIKNLRNEVYELKDTIGKLDTGLSTWDKYKDKILLTEDETEELEEELETLEETIGDDLPDSWDNLSTAAKFAWVQEYRATEKAKEHAKLLEGIADAQKQIYKGQEVSSDDITNYKANLEDLAMDRVEDLIDSGAIDAESEYIYDKFVSNLLDNFDDKTLTTMMATGKNYGQTFADAFADSIDTIEIMNDESLSLSERIAAFRELYNIAAQYGESASEAFEGLAKNLATLSNNLSDSDISMLDKYGLSLEQISDLWDALNNKGNSSQFANVIDMIMSGSYSATEILKKLQDLTGTTDTEAQSLLSGVLSASSVSDLISTRTSLTGAADTIRENQQKWNSMTQEEQASFWNDYIQYFTDENGNLNKAMQEAFLTGQDMTQYFIEENQDKINDYVQALKNARLEAESEGDQDALYEIDQLLAQVDSMFDESFDTILEREEDQLSVYKDMLEQQNDALVDSLNARKDAYQKYFDTVNDLEDEQDRNEERQRLQQQMIKLGGATDAASVKSLQDLQDSLEDLEEEQTDADRQAAQDKIIDDIDSQIDDANDYLDKLTNNSELMLEKMNSSDLNSMAMSYLLNSGMTQNQMTDWLNTNSNLLGLDFTNMDLDSSDTLNSIVSTMTNSTFNFNNQQLKLSETDATTIAQIFLAAAKQAGKV